jgi:error-prone DNA polymerase
VRSPAGAGGFLLSTPEWPSAGVPINQLIAQRLADPTDLLNLLSVQDESGEWAERTLGRADEVRRADPGSRPARVAVPPSRNFH